MQNRNNAYLNNGLNEYNIFNLFSLFQTGLKTGQEYMERAFSPQPIQVSNINNLNFLIVKKIIFPRCLYDDKIIIYKS